MTKDILTCQILVIVLCEGWHLNLFLFYFIEEEWVGSCYFVSRHLTTCHGKFLEWNVEVFVVKCDGQNWKNGPEENVSCPIIPKALDIVRCGVIDSKEYNVSQETSDTQE